MGSLRSLRALSSARSPRGLFSGLLLGVIACGFGSLDCSGGQPDQELPPVRLASTTSTANTGLLDHLAEAFEQETGIAIQYVAVGTGKALKHGENGDVDLLLVHAPEAEEEFIANGFGVERVPLMWNDFVILGPPADPAGVVGSRDLSEALQRIARRESAFVCRGDESGTHKKERALWDTAGIVPAGEWYIDAGQGMGACLMMASEKEAYILSDRGTFLAYRDRIGLEIVYEGDSLLVNPYSLIAINPDRYPDLNHTGAARLIAWLTAPGGQRQIAEFRVGGEQLFHPTDALPGESSGQ